MSNILKSKTFKVGGLVIAIAMMVGVASVASAQTTTTTTTVVASGYTYSGVMKAGMSGPGISTLQAALNSVQSSPQIVVDGKFGPATLAAVKAFQASKGLVADGVVGPKTGAALTAATVAVITVPGGFPPGCTSNAGFSTTTGKSCAVSMTLPAGCTSTSGYSSTTGAKCDGGSTSGGSDGTLSGGETSIENLDVNDADESDIQEGDSEAEVAEIEFDVEDADAELVRADLIFDGTGATEDKPWNVFDAVYLMNGSDTIAEVDSDDEDAWSETDTDDVYSIRLNNINEVFDEGTDVTLTVAVDVASSVDDAGTDADWSVEVASDPGEEDGLRFTDSEGIETFEGSDEKAEFSIVEEGEDNDYSLSSSSEDPEASTIEVDDDGTSDFASVFIFNFEADEDSDEDLLIEDMKLNITLDDPAGGETPTHADVIDEVTVMIDGTEYDAEIDETDADFDDVMNNTTESVLYEVDLDDEDATVAAGDEVEVEVMVKFKALTNNYDSGTTIVVDVDSANLDVVGADSDDTVTDPSDTVTGDTHTLGVVGIVVPAESVVTDTDTQGTNDTIGVFTIEFEVTAFGEDLYIAESALAAANAGTGGVEFSVESGAAPTSASGVLSSDADEDTAGVFTVNEGDTETFTLTVTVDASAAGAHRVILEEVWFSENPDGVTGSVVHETLPANDFDTQQQVINQ